MANEGEICRNVTSTQVDECNDDENQSGSPLTWCADDGNNITSCFYSIYCCRYVPIAVENQPPPVNNIPPRPDTSVQPANEQTQGSNNNNNLFGTTGGVAVNNQGSQLLTSYGNNDATHNEQSYHPPSPAPSGPSGAGVGIGFALVAIAIAAVILWKRDSDKEIKSDISSKTGIIMNNTSTSRNSPTRGEKNPRIRRDNSSRRRSSNESVGSRRSSNGSVRSHKERKKRTIYDSDDSLDSDFKVNRRMSIDPINSDSNDEFSVKSIPL